MSEKDLFILGKQFIPFEVLPELKKIYEKYKRPNDDILLWFQVYQYGVMQGKRAERVKRKASKVKSEVSPNG